MKRTPLRRRSNKYGKELDTYNHVVKPQWLALHPYCQFDLGYENKCGILCGIAWGVTVHHMMGRGKYLNDSQYFMSACPVHHDWIESNKREARKLGYILYK